MKKPKTPFDDPFSPEEQAALDSRAQAAFERLAASGYYVSYETSLMLVTFAYCQRLVDEHTRLVAELYEGVTGVKPDVQYLRKQDNSATEVAEDLAQWLGEGI